MAEKVKIYHPVTGGHAVVPATSVAQHARAGWQLEEQEELAPVIDEPGEGNEEDSQ